MAVPSNSTHGAGYDDEDKQAIFARFLSRAATSSLMDRLGLAAKIAAALPFRVSQKTVDRWLKARGILSTDNRGAGRFKSVTKTGGPTLRNEAKPSVPSGRRQRQAHSRHQGIQGHEAAGGGWSMKTEEEQSSSASSLRGKASAPARPILSLPIQARQLHPNDHVIHRRAKMNEITAAIASHQEPHPADRRRERNRAMSRQPSRVS